MLASKRMVVLICALFFWSYASQSQAGSDRSDSTLLNAPKKTIFVGIFESPEGATGEAMSAMLTDALIRDGRFVVLERAAFADVQAEQALGQQGITSPETSAKTGQVLGANLIVRGTVTKFEIEAGGADIKVGGLNLLGGAIGDTLGASRRQAETEILLRLIDTTTAQVIGTFKATGHASVTGVNADVTTLEGITIGSEAFRKTPLGAAADEAIQKSVQQIAKAMDRISWSALVVENVDGAVYVNAGALHNMRPGTVLRVSRKVRDLTDPATGAHLDTIFAEVGSVEIQSVRERTSIARIVDGAEPARGDTLRIP